MLVSPFLFSWLFWFCINIQLYFYQTCLFLFIKIFYTLLKANSLCFYKFENVRRPDLGWLSRKKSAGDWRRPRNWKRNLHPFAQVERPRYRSLENLVSICLDSLKVIGTKYDPDWNVNPFSSKRWTETVATRPWRWRAMHHTHLRPLKRRGHSSYGPRSSSSPPSRQ